MAAPMKVQNVQKSKRNKKYSQLRVKGLFFSMIIKYLPWFAWLMHIYDHLHMLQEWEPPTWVTPTPRVILRFWKEPAWVHRGWVGVGDALPGPLYRLVLSPRYYEYWLSWASNGPFLQRTALCWCEPPGLRGGVSPPQGQLPAMTSRGESASWPQGRDHSMMKFMLQGCLWFRPSWVSWITSLLALFPSSLLPPASF